MMTLENTKVGDQLILYSNSSDRRVVTVTRTTKCFVVTNQGGGRFNRNGKMPGADRWTRWWVKPGTPENIAIIRAEGERRQSINRLFKVDWTEMTDEQLQATHASLPEHITAKLVEVR